MRVCRIFRVALMFARIMHSTPNPGTFILFAILLSPVRIVLSIQFLVFIPFCSPILFECSCSLLVCTAIYFLISHFQSIVDVSLMLEKAFFRKFSDIFFVATLYVLFNLHTFFYIPCSLVPPLSFFLVLPIRNSVLLHICLVRI